MIKTMSDRPTSRRLRAYMASRRWLGRGVGFLDALHRGVWLGLFDRSTLQELTDRYYADSGAGSAGDMYLGPDFNLSGLEPFEEAALGRHFQNCETLLIGSSGGGREILALSPRMRELAAFECNPTLLRACRSLLRSEGLSVRLVGASPGRVPAGLEVYDGAICGWGAYMHVVGKEQRVELLRGFHEHVETGGPLLLSFFTRRGSRSHRLSNCLASAIRRLRRGEPVEEGDCISDTFDHHFTEAEIREELAEGGFDTIFFSEEGYGHAVGRALPDRGRSRVVPATSPDTRPAESKATFRVRAYLRSRRWSRGLLDGVRNIHQGIWLGLLDHPTCRELTQSYYATGESGAKGAAQYSESAFNLSGLQRWEEAVVERFYGACRSVLVGSAGGGREALALSQQGRRVEAFECNPHLLDLCRSLFESQGVDARVLPAAPDEVPGDLGSYDGAILGWCAYVHVLGRDRRIRFLRQLRAHLVPGGPLLLSFVLRDGTSGRPGYGIARLLRRLRGAVPPEPGEWVGGAAGRSFTESEVRSELEEAGLETVFFSSEGSGHVVARSLPALRDEI